MERVLIFVSALLVPPSASEADCGVCLALNEWLPVKSSCHQCGGWRPTWHAPASDTVDVRVTKALGSKGYDQVRVSVIQRQAAGPLSPDIEAAFKDKVGAAISPFKYRWEHSSYYTRIMSASDTGNLPEPLRPAKMPAQGAGVTGLLFGDPCSINSWVGCGLAQQFHTSNTTPALVNLFMDKADLNFYAMLGDNFYDQTGEITAPFWNALTSRSKSKVLMVVPGNHDFWVQGSSVSRLLFHNRSDQFGYGQAQWHMMDSVAAKASLNHTGFGSNPVFDYTVDPDAPSWPEFAEHDPIARASNFFWYNQLGDVVFVGFSGAHNWEMQQAYFLEACEFVRSVQTTTSWVVLLGHWDFNGHGVVDHFSGGELDTPSGFWKMATSSCSAFKDYYERGRLKYAAGHTHCNIANPYSHPGSKGASNFSLVDNRTGYDGFLLGGMGMLNPPGGICDHRELYGAAVLATTPGGKSGDRLELVYFKVGAYRAAGSIYQYDAVEKCVASLGWRKCSSVHPEVADVWLNVTAPSWDRVQLEADAESTVYV